MTIVRFKGIDKVIIWNYVLKSVYLINEREITYFTRFFTNEFVTIRFNGGNALLQSYNLIYIL